MSFARQVRDRLHFREIRAPLEFATGEKLGVILTRDLLAVEAAADNDMLTSILLLDGNRLTHGAAPRLPATYCAAIDGSEIGPTAGSCGTAAFFGHPVFVNDIAGDPLWADYRDLALEHGLQACWSTPIFNDEGAVLGTFAMYHLTPRGPTRDEVDAIDAITEHVARAIIWSKRTGADSQRRSAAASRSKPILRLVANTDMHAMVNHTDDLTGSHPGQAALSSRQLLLNIVSDIGAIGSAIEFAINGLGADEPESADLPGLRRAKKAAKKAAKLVRKMLGPDRIP